MISWLFSLSFAAPPSISPDFSCNAIDTAVVHFPIVHPSAMGAAQYTRLHPLLEHLELALEWWRNPFDYPDDPIFVYTESMGLIDILCTQVEGVLVGEFTTRDTSPDLLIQCAAPYSGYGLVRNFSTHDSTDASRVVLSERPDNPRVLRLGAGFPDGVYFGISGDFQAIAAGTMQRILDMPAGINEFDICHAVDLDDSGSNDVLCTTSTNKWFAAHSRNNVAGAWYELVHPTPNASQRFVGDMSSVALDDGVSVLVARVPRPSATSVFLCNLTAALDSGESEVASCELVHTGIPTSTRLTGAQFTANGDMWLVSIDSVNSYAHYWRRTGGLVFAPRPELAATLPRAPGHRLRVSRNGTLVIDGSVYLIRLERCPTNTDDGTPAVSSTSVSSGVSDVPTGVPVSAPPSSTPSPTVYTPPDSVIIGAVLGGLCGCYCCGALAFLCYRWHLWDQHESGTGARTPLPPRGNASSSHGRHGRGRTSQLKRFTSDVYATISLSYRNTRGQRTAEPSECTVELANPVVELGSTQAPGTPTYSAIAAEELQYAGVYDDANTGYSELELGNHYDELELRRVRDDRYGGFEEQKS